MLNQRWIIERINYINGLKSIIKGTPWVLPVVLSRHKLNFRLEFSAELVILEAIGAWWTIKLDHSRTYNSKYGKKLKVSSKPKYMKNKATAFEIGFDAKQYYNRLNWAYCYLRTYFLNTVFSRVPKTINFNRTLHSNRMVHRFQDFFNEYPNIIPM